MTRSAGQDADRYSADGHDSHGDTTHGDHTPSSTHSVATVDFPAAEGDVDQQQAPPGTG